MIICTCGREFTRGVCYNCGNTSAENFKIIPDVIFSKRESKAFRISNKVSARKKKRNRIKKRDGKCLKCGSKKKLTIDHIKPLSKGGTWNNDNLQTLCSKCNGEKRDQEIDYRQNKTLK